MGVAGEKGRGRSEKCRVSSEEKCDETGVWRRPLLVLTLTFVYRERSFPNRFAKIILAPQIILAAVFWCMGFLLVRCIRERESGRRPVGFPRVSMFGLLLRQGFEAQVGRTNLGQVHWDSRDG
jgi:hypothetical protein